jgi:hypothetical protein
MLVWGLPDNIRAEQEHAIMNIGKGKVKNILRKCSC